MTASAPPALTVRSDGSERTFAAGHDVVIGRDLRADMRITHPLISRAHLLLRFDQGRWLAIDNGSLNGTFANGRKVPVVDIHDGQSINIGNPDGPLLTFEVGRHQGMAGRPPQTESMGIPAPQPAAAAWPASQPSGHPPPPPRPGAACPPPPPPAPPAPPPAPPPGPPPGPPPVRAPNRPGPPPRPYTRAPGQRPAPPGHPAYPVPGGPGRAAAVA